MAVKCIFILAFLLHPLPTGVLQRWFPSYGSRTTSAFVLADSRGIRWSPLSLSPSSFLLFHFVSAVLAVFFNWGHAPWGLRGCKNWPALFPGRMLYKATKPGLIYVLYLSIDYMVSLFIRAPFYLLLVFIAMCAVFWLFWLSYQD